MSREHFKNFQKIFREQTTTDDESERTQDQTSVQEPEKPLPPLPPRNSVPPPMPPALGERSSKGSEATSKPLTKPLLILKRGATRFSDLKLTQLRYRESWTTSKPEELLITQFEKSIKTASPVAKPVFSTVKDTLECPKIKTGQFVILKKNKSRSISYKYRLESTNLYISKNSSALMAWFWILLSVSTQIGLTKRNTISLCHAQNL